MFRRFDPMVVFDLPQQGGTFIRSVNGVDLFVDTVNGSDARTGRSWDKALATVGQAFTLLETPKSYVLPGHRKGSNSRIFVIGDVREHATAPLGVYGCQLIGGYMGQPRHATSNGAAVDGNGCNWRDTATPGTAPLLDLIEQGWEVHNMMFVPPASYGSIRLHREETTTYPDSSHAIISHCRFFNGSAAGYGVDDYGSTSHALIEWNTFDSLEFAYHAGGVGISAPNRHTFRENDFVACKNDITGNFYQTKILWNRFHTAYNASTHPNTVNMAYTADSGVAASSNNIMHNTFADAAANVVIAKGYKPATGDIWRNWVTDTAAYIVAVPA